MKSKEGKIFICPTPIGNLADISYRLKEVLESSDEIYSEDTRVTSKLLHHLGIKKHIKRLDDNIMDNASNSVIEEVKSGKIVAYCSDAGTPGVSDPGSKLVNKARFNNVKVEVLPGPCAAITAYVASGFICPNFYFAGFFPRKSSLVSKLLLNFSDINSVLIFYESPKRLVNTLKTIYELFPQRKLAVCRELTKMHEDVFVGGPKDALEYYSCIDKIRGEVVIVIDALDNVVKKQNNKNLEKISKFVLEAYNMGLKSADIAKLIMSAFGLRRNEAYNIVLSVKS